MCSQSGGFPAGAGSGRCVRRLAAGPRRGAGPFVRAGSPPAPPGALSWVPRGGRPPAPEEVAAFVADRRPDAYERVVDRLLADPRYGECGARHWLDVAGYADSEGVLQEDRVRPNAWRYRDYVIRSFNTDKPYDR